MDVIFGGTKSLATSTTLLRLPHCTSSAACTRWETNPLQYQDTQESITFKVTLDTLKQKHYALKQTIQHLITVLSSHIKEIANTTHRHDKNTNFSNTKQWPLKIIQIKCNISDHLNNYIIHKSGKTSDNNILPFHAPFPIWSKLKLFRCDKNARWQCY